MHSVERCGERQIPSGDAVLSKSACLHAGRAAEMGGSGSRVSRRDFRSRKTGGQRGASAAISGQGLSIYFTPVRETTQLARGREVPCKASLERPSGFESKS